MLIGIYMAVSGPKGPGSDAKGPVHLKPERETEKSNTTKKLTHTEPTADEFERIAESLAGSDLDQSDAAKKRKRGRDHIKRTRAVLSRTVSRMGDDLKKFQSEAAQILSIMAAQGFSQAAIERHKRELARLRERIDRAYRHILKNKRGVRENALGLDAIGKSKLARVEDEIERLNQFETQWGKAMAALELICEAAEEDVPRRIELKGADPQLAEEFATTSNPTTVAIDLASSALQLLQTQEPADASTLDASEIGPSLRGQKTLLDLITPEQEN